MVDFLLEEHFGEDCILALGEEQLHFLVGVLELELGDVGWKASLKVI